MQAMRNGAPMLIASGYVSQVDKALCIQCGICEDTCPFDALLLGETGPEIELAACMGCGLCVEACDQGALTLRREESKGMPLEIAALMELNSA